MYTETHAELLKTSCFSISVTDAFYITLSDQYLPYSYKTIGVFAQSCYIAHAVQNKFLLSITPFTIRVKETKIPALEMYPQKYKAVPLVYVCERVREDAESTCWAN